MLRKLLFLSAAIGLITRVFNLVMRVSMLDMQREDNQKEETV